jgi:hypothetical protein
LYRFVKINPLDMASSVTATRKKITRYSRKLVLIPLNVIVIFVVIDNITIISNISTMPRTAPKSNPLGFSIELRNIGFDLSMTFETNNIAENVLKNIAI